MMQPETGAAPIHHIVLDTNIVLDLFVFNDPATVPLKQALQSRQWRWLATGAMRDELARVLSYPNIVPRLACCQLTAEQVLTLFDAQAQTVDAAARAQVSCADPDDQPFIDLAVAHQTMLLSKDKAVLAMKKRLLALGVVAQSAIKPIA